MKPLSRFAAAMLVAACGAAFAAPQTTAHQATPAPAAHAAPAKHDLKYEKHQIRVEEKTALASCKTMKGAQKSACKKDAIAKASSARAHLKAAKHA